MYSFLFSFCIVGFLLIIIHMLVYTLPTKETFKQEKYAYRQVCRTGLCQAGGACGAEFECGKSGFSMHEIKNADAFTLPRPTLPPVPLRSSFSNQSINSQDTTESTEPFAPKMFQVKL